MLSVAHSYAGKLIVVEGIDGSGKSTQLSLLHRWLLSRGYKVFCTEWNSSVLVRRSMRRGKHKDLLTPTTFSVTNTGWTRSNLLSQTINVAKAGHALTVTTFSLLYAADFGDRLENTVIPALRAGSS